MKLSIAAARIPAMVHTDLEAMPLLSSRPQNQAVENRGRMRHLFPYLWLWHNWEFNACMGLRFASVFAVRYANVQIPRQLGIIANHLAASKTPPWGNVFAWASLKVLSSDFGLNGIGNLASTYTACASYKKLAVHLFSYILKLGVPFHSRKDTGEIIKCIDQAQSLTQLVDLVLFQILSVVFDLINTMVYVASDFGLSAMFTLLSVVITYILLSISLAAWINPKRRALAQADRATSSIATETLSNYRLVSYFGNEAYEQDRYTKAITANVVAQCSCKVSVCFGKAAQDAVMTLGHLVVAIVVLRDFRSKKHPVGDFVRFLMHWENIRKPLKIIKQSWDNITAAVTSAEASSKLLNTKPSVLEAELAEELVDGPGKVIFHDVAFGYSDCKQTLQGVSFVAEPGRTIAIVGESGSGKSTIGELLHRHYDVTAGSITIDGQDIRSVKTNSLKKALGSVPQDCRLFNTSILENVRYGHSSANKDDIEEACKAAGIHEKILSLPGGYDFKVGENGNLLSGGERQRITIARLFLKDPRVVFLDEATSAVDTSTESQIQAALERFCSNRTTIVIAHRLSTIVGADMILVLNEGKVIEQGTSDELLQRPDGKYAELWSRHMFHHTGLLSNYCTG